MIALLVLLQTTLTIAVAGPATSPEYLPLRLADAAGYFAEEKISVSLRSDRAEAAPAEALGRGQVALAATSLDAALLHGHAAGAPPRLVFGLTAAPPVALVVSSPQQDAIRALPDLAGKTIGIPSPGTPAELALFSLLDRARLRRNQVSVVSYGERGLAGAIESGAVAAAIMGDPWATRLAEEGKAVVLADLRRRDEAARWLGKPTVHAGLFARADTTLGRAELVPLARALLRAQALVRTAPAEELERKLPAAVVVSPEDFAVRLRGARESFLPDGRVSAERLGASVALARDRSPIPGKVNIPRRMDKLLLQEPLEEALGRRAR
jgi:ABC-type nitrate/sulfonate/bicarbonate transport system substrate-binding protein